jgi:signal transduction histidine kinase
MRLTIPLQRALLGAIAAAILAGMIPAGIVLDRRLAAELEARARADLALAPRILADRTVANNNVLMMYAKDFAHVSGLAAALMAGDRVSVLRIVDSARSSIGGGDPVVIGATGDAWVGGGADSALVAGTRAGKMPVELRRDGSVLRTVALAPVVVDGRWVGAAGVTTPIDERAAGVLSGLTRSDVVIVADGRNMIAATTLDTAAARAVTSAVLASARDSANATIDVVVGGKRLLAVPAALAPVGTVVFVRSLDAELAVLPQLRRVAGVSAVAALVVALALGALLAARVSRPVRQLAGAAAALGDGEFGVPVPQSRVREVARVAGTFDEMRRALAARLADLRQANAALTDRNARLTALQADLMQRDRLAATGRLVTQLAHEIRNPIANLRNCLELIRRRVGNDAEAVEFADLAIDELLRLHELAEQMLDLNRPRDPASSRCRPIVVAREVAALASAGISHHELIIAVDGDETVEAAIAPDALKQVLVNLVQNAREAAAIARSHAAAEPTRIAIMVARTNDVVQLEVADNGPGIPAAILPRIFDPFFTTKEAVHGVGLGLFVAEGLVRTAGGSIAVENTTPDTPRASGNALGGARFRITLAVPADSGSPGSGNGTRPDILTAPLS